MVYVIIDDCLTKRASIWDTKFQTKEEAIEYADAEWKALTDHDKKDRDDYYVASVELDSDGEIDWNTLEPIKEYK